MKKCRGLSCVRTQVNADGYCLPCAELEVLAKSGANEYFRGAPKKSTSHKETLIKCVVCGNGFVVKNTRGMYCSKDCYNAMKKKEKQQKELTNVIQLCYI